MSGPLPRSLLQFALFWFLQLAGLGLILPYYSLYLRENVGLPESQVGIVVSALPMAGIAAQAFWGLVSDRTGARRLVLVVLCLGASASSLLLGQLTAFGWLLAGTALVAIFERALLPLANSVSLAVLPSVGRHAFALARSFGTVGFLAAVVTLPLLLGMLRSSRPAADPSASPSEPALGMIFPLAASFYLAAAFVAWRLPAADKLRLRSRRGDAARLLRFPPVLRLLLGLFLANLFSQGPLYLLPILVRSKGGDVTTVSLMWLLMLLVEIPLVAAAEFLRRRLGVRGLMRLALATEGLRWMVSAWTGSLAVLVAVQALHAFSVVGLLLGGALYLDETVPDNLRSTGQAWVAMAGVGAGGILSSSLTGYLIELAGPTLAYTAAGAGALSLALLALRLVPAPRKLLASG